MAGREHVSSVASEPPVGFEMEEGSPQGVDPDHDDAPPTAEDVNKLPLRHSVIMMEVSPRRRYIGIGITLAVSLFFVFFTPIYVVERFHLVPQKPNTDNLEAKMVLYQNFTNHTNTILAAEMYLIYNRSVEWEQEQCADKLNYIYNEQDLTKADSGYFVGNYCQSVATRLFATGQALMNVDSSSLENCLLSPKSNSIQFANASKYVHWLVSENDIDPAATLIDCSTRYAYYDEDTDKTTHYCIQSLIIQRSWCTGSFKWDDRYDFWTGDESTAKKCAAVQIALQNQYDDTLTSNALGFKESVAKRTEYDENYFLGTSDLFTNIKKSADNIADALPAIEDSFSNWDDKFSSNVASMRDLYNIYQDATFGIDLGAFGLDALTPPDFDYPPYPAEELAEVQRIIDQMSTATDGLRDYNPPEVVYPEADNVIEFSRPSVKFQQADVDFRASTLIEDVKNTWNTVLNFVGAFQVADFLIRICLFLHDVAFVLREQRRDMTSLKTRFRNSSALILENLTVLVYVILIAVIAGIVATSDVDVAQSIRDEAQVSCNNDIIVKNSQILVDYQNDVAKLREECNAGLSNENTKLNNVNSVFVDSFKATYEPWERLFNATQPNGLDNIDFTNVALTPRTYTNFPKGYSPYNLLRMYLPPNAPYRGQTVSYVDKTEIEAYYVKPSLCNSSSEAKQLADAVNESANAYITYITGVLVCALGMIIAMRMFVWGLRFIFWMEITKGYMFDEEFNSARLKTRIRNERIKGVVMILISAVIFFVMLGVYA